MKKKQAIFRVFLGVTACIITGLSVKAVEFNRIIQGLDAQVVASQSELQKDKKRLEELKTERETMNSPEYIEKVAREKLGMVKADDIVFKQK